MAYRKIHDDFWTDPDVEELTPEQKFFYLYLITNPNVNQIGLYEFSHKRASFETGYNIDTVSKLLDTFEEMGKIKRSYKTKEILVIKFYWHNKSGSPKVVTHVNGLLELVKDKSLIQYIYGMYIASQEEEEEVQEKEEAKSDSKELVKSFIPTLKECQDYAIEKGYGAKLGKKFFDYYNVSVEGKPKSKYWKDSRGNPVKGWKQKMQVWFKPENKNNNEHKIIDGGTW